MHVPPMIAASPGGWVDEAVQALEGTNVFVSPEVGDPGLAGQLEQQIGDASIGVAVLPENALLEMSTTDIVDVLMTETGYDTIIVAVGEDIAADSDVLPEDEALRIANVAESSTDSVEDALAQTVTEITAVSQAPSGSDPDATGMDGGVIVGLALAVAVLVGAGIAVVRVVRSRARRGAAGEEVPEGLSAQIATLKSLSAEYAAVGASGNQVAAQTGQEIAVLADNAAELFARLDGRSADDQRSIAAVEYDDKLRKLTAALNRDYLLDILTHPHLWDDPDDRVQEVLEGLHAVSAELLQNIKQVNARRGLHFQVSLDGLIGGRKELQDWDRAFNDAADDGTPSA